MTIRIQALLAMLFCLFFFPTKAQPPHHEKFFLNLDKHPDDTIAGKLFVPIEDTYIYNLFGNPAPIKKTQLLIGEHIYIVKTGGRREIWSSFTYFGERDIHAEFLPWEMVQPYHERVSPGAVKDSINEDWYLFGDSWVKDEIKKLLPFILLALCLLLFAGHWYWNKTFEVFRDFLKTRWGMAAVIVIMLTYPIVLFFWPGYMLNFHLLSNWSYHLFFWSSGLMETATVPIVYNFQHIAFIAVTMLLQLMCILLAVWASGAYLSFFTLYIATPRYRIYGRRYAYGNPPANMSFDKLVMYWFQFMVPVLLSALLMYYFIPVNDEYKWRSLLILIGLVLTMILIYHTVFSKIPILHEWLLKAGRNLLGFCVHVVLLFIVLLTINLVNYLWMIRS
ncbi:hypothetical protein SAMN04488122_5122 [Chitinophaga arvensicola]|uniref:Uncharacterized protein n=2 Tax=Chitinophaga arvensicola TaxID=29529 RepID=A0A1I0S9E8_9BACT|nr:hypothetical protein SAMN04488122_5122 [Chitinophaga arvensicola]